MANPFHGYKAPEASDVENLGSFEVGVIPISALWYWCLKRKCRCQSHIRRLRRKVLVVTASSKKMIILHVKPKGIVIGVLTVRVVLPYQARKGGSRVGV